VANWDGELGGRFWWRIGVPDWVAQRFQRCGKCFACFAASAAGVNLSRRTRVFLQPLQPCRWIEPGFPPLRLASLLFQYEPLRIHQQGNCLAHTAHRVYRIAAVLSLTIYVTLPAILINGPSPILRQILFVGVVGMAVTMVGMEVFLFRFHDSPAWKQMF